MKVGGRAGRRIGRVACFLAVAVLAPAARAASPAQVQRAIDAGRTYLFKHQHDGNWEAVPKPDKTEKSAGPSVKAGQWGGLTAVATLGLLAAGTPASDEHVKAAIGFLRTAEIRGTYALGMRAQVWNLIPPEPWVRQAELADLKLLQQGLHTAKGRPLGMYGYLTTSVSDDYDHSVSQFGVLGMWSLSQAGVEVPTAYWRIVEDAWHRQQLPGGGWSYDGRPIFGPRADKKETLSMTAAGAATLFVAQEFTQVAPKCNGNPVDPALDAAVRALGQRLADLPAVHKYYAMFGVSRVGLASGYKHLGDTDWFAWGSDILCHDQHADGGWTSFSLEPTTGTSDTAFALLFLSRGNAPVMVNKLRYDVVAGTGPSAKSSPGTWNQRPRDVANLSRWVGRQLEVPLNWQVVALTDSADDLLDAPLLYMAGGKSPALSPADVDKLRAYCEDGGLLVGHADCASPEFVAGFHKLGEQLFPGRHFRPLEATHPIYTNQMFPRDKWATKPPLEGLSNGARELMVLLPAGDPAKVWQGRAFQPVKNEPGGQMMVDLFLYAVEREGLRKRGETYLVRRKPDAPTPARAVRVARLKYAGNWDPEPGGWRRLANVLHNDGTVELTVEPVDPATAKLDPALTPLASLTVTDSDAALTPAAMAAVRDYVKAGGTLLLDVAAGRSAGRAAATANLAKLFPDAAHELPVLPPDDPLYTAGGPKLSVGKVDFRRFERSRRAVHEPQLRGWQVDGRTAVLYSAEDVSVGLVGEPIDGVAGYVPTDATRVVSAVIAYAAKLRP